MNDTFAGLNDKLCKMKPDEVFGQIEAGWPMLHTIPSEAPCTDVQERIAFRLRVRELLKADPLKDEDFDA